MARQPFPHELPGGLRWGMVRLRGRLRAAADAIGHTARGERGHCASAALTTCPVHNERELLMGRRYQGRGTVTGKQAPHYSLLVAVGIASIKLASATPPASSSS